MTKQEVCERFNISESTLLNNFPRVQKSILKKHNVKLIKEGKGAAAIYRVEENDCRALTMYEEVKDNFVIDNESFKLMNLDFHVFLAIVLTPMLVFRGSFEEFLKYAEINVTKENVLALKGTLSSLEERNFISYNLDRTNKDYFVAAILRRTEEEMSIGINMVRTCKMLADKHNKRSWIPLLKTWIGVQIAAENQPFTMDTLVDITGLSLYQLRESRRILEKDDIFKSSRAYIAFDKCIGTNIDLNAFYNS